jgi:hypothetical protein
MGLHRNCKDQKRDDDDTRNMDKRSRRNEKDLRICDTKIPVENTIPKNNPIPNQKYPKVHFLNPNPTRN